MTTHTRTGAGGTLGLALDGIVLGCDYNPEQWDPTVWQEDVALMREAGVRLVAINIFGWSHVNPADGRWDFAALDQVMDLLHAHGIRVNLGTGTASTPAWLTRQHPEILPVAADGTTRYPGGRQAWCPSSPILRDRALDLVARVAERYGDHPALALWHVSNELGCHNAHCYCDASADAFRGWLRERYGTVDALNAAWGTAFWSQRYGAFDEILPPRLTLSSRNPGQMLDFHRFSSDALLDHYRAEAEVIRARSDAPVTTNFMVTAHIRNLDYWTWASDMDVVANDHYLDHRLADPVTEMAFAADLTRGLAGGAPWMLMETAVGAVNWQPLNRARAAGELRRHALTHVARGADSVCFFQWRASAQGAEKFHSALLPHAGTDSRAWRESVELGRELGVLAEVAGTRVEAHVAILFDWISWWTLDGEGNPSTHVRYLEQVHHAYRALRAAGVTVDVVPAGAALDGYRLVVVPALHAVQDAAADTLDAYVRDGGSALVTFASGIVDHDDRVRLGGYPGAFRDMLGIRVDEMCPVAPDEELALDDGSRASLWSERVELRGAEAVASFASGPALGHPAVTRHRRGDGLAWYAATALAADAYAALVARAADDAGVSRDPHAGPHVELVRRTGHGRTYVFAINNSDRPVPLDVRGTDLLTGEVLRAATTLDAGEARIVREETR
ncbi:beta-galactosidase [Demequina maris]|uniref:beta-galactosidase n=1 Tax=Demequina maris TaxID=1638982 RepID=UPI00078435FF|nr:beta-galactosidase [Demequina maris]